jgi:hypothetical protein
MPGSQATADSLWEQINNVSEDSPSRNTRHRVAAHRGQGSPSQQDQSVVLGTQSQQRQDDTGCWVVPETQPQLGQHQTVVLGTPSQ